jgi:AcrR family transcriptional regulator
MARKYEMKQRAARVAETRDRIVAAAIELHSTLGPARTTLSDVARRAGVQRQTLYRHFPDERALGLACSGDYTARNPPPDPEPWRSIADPAERLRRGLRELYAYFEQNEPMLSRVLRDAEVEPLTRELVELRHRESTERIHSVLTRGIRGRRRRAVVSLAVDFRTWQRLVRECDLGSADAAELMTRALNCQ